MRTEVQEIKIFQFEELREEIQEKVIDNWRYNDPYVPWLDEIHDTLVEFCKIFDLNLVDYSYGSGYRDYIKVNFKYDDYEELAGFRLNSKLWEEYSKYIFYSCY